MKSSPRRRSGTPITLPLDLQAIVDSALSYVETAREQTVLRSIKQTLDSGDQIDAPKVSQLIKQASHSLGIDSSRPKSLVTLKEGVASAYKTARRWKFATRVLLGVTTAILIAPWAAAFLVPGMTMAMLINLSAIAALPALGAAAVTGVAAAIRRHYIHRARQHQSAFKDAREAFRAPREASIAHEHETSDKAVQVAIDAKRENIDRLVAEKDAEVAERRDAFVALIPQRGKVTHFGEFQPAMDSILRSWRDNPLERDNPYHLANAIRAEADGGSLWTPAQQQTGLDSGQVLASVGS